MSDKQTTLRRSYQDAWLNGYQTAVDAMRDWADKFANEETRPLVLLCADMVEAAKPTPP